MTQQSDKSAMKGNSVEANEPRFKALLAACSDTIYSMSADWRVMKELDGRGFLQDTLEPATDWLDRYIPSQDIPQAKALIEKVIKEKKMFQLEHRVIQADGSTGWVYSRAVPILNDHGEIAEWLGTASNITAHKRAEEALQQAVEQSEKQRRLYEAITSGTPDLMYVFDLEYRFTYVNSALLSMWGKTWDESVGKGLLENGYEPWHAEMHQKEIDQVRATKKPIRGEVAFPHAILGKRTYDYIFTPVFDKHGEVEAVAGTTRDVTERKQYEDAMALSSAKLQELNEEMAATNEELISSNEELVAANTQLESVNKELTIARQNTEHAEESLRMAIESGELATWYLSDKLDTITASARFTELFGFGSEGEIPYQQALSQIHSEYRKSVQDAFSASFQKGISFNVEYPLTSARDNRQRWVRSVGKLVKDDKNGNFIAGVMADITEQKMDEIRKNDFIGMVSHELKTPLTSMKGYIQMLLVKLRQRNDDLAVSALEKTNTQIAKMTRMINDFLNVSRLESGKIHINLQQFDIALLINEVAEEIYATIGSHTIVFAPVGTIFVNADRDKIGQVIHNLISNAVKYSPAGSTINVACKYSEGLVNVSVTDQGMGIKPDDLPKIFDRFYRVEDHHMFSISGFGIGLYLCSEILKRQNGHIWAESVFGKGSTFTFSLPSYGSLEG